MTDLNEESVVRGMATMLSAVLKENPQLTKFILEPNKMWIPDYEDDALEEASE